MIEYIACFVVGVISGAAIWAHAERKYRRQFYAKGMHRACDLIGTEYAHSPNLPIHPTPRLTIAIARCRSIADKL